MRAETGLKVKILRGEDEARLAFRSALAHFDLGVGRAVVMDIGGGSLELALSADGLVERLISLPFGAIRTTERYLRLGRRKRKRMRKLRKHVRLELRRQLSARHWQRRAIICSGGTFTNLGVASTSRASGWRARKTVHGTVIPRVELEHIVDMLHNMSPAERQTVPGLNAARSDIIVGGLAVVAEVAARIEAKELVVSGYGIREGILLESARVAPSPADPERRGSDRCASWRSDRITRSRTRSTFRSSHSSCSIRSASGSAAHPTTDSSSPTRRCCTTSDITSATTSTTSIHTI